LFVTESTPVPKIPNVDPAAQQQDEQDGTLASFAGDDSSDSF
jgi:hypothetical protein